VGILESAPIRDIKHLLELFPLTKLRQNWNDLRGTKEDLCFGAAERRKAAELAQFLDENVSCCKQHVYIFDRGGRQEFVFPESLIEGEKVVQVGNDHALYIIRARYSVVLKNPLEEDELEFLWPVQILLLLDHIVIRFVTLEKNIGSYFDRPYYVGSRNVDERAVLDAFLKELPISRTDLHKGVKTLWDAGFMDSPRARYKKPTSTAQEAMDEELGIREHNPELYETLQDSVLFNTLFAIPEDKGCTVSAFSVDPSNGYMAFVRYSEKKGDTDFVIREILQQNQ
jgi:hypothetical protein